MRAILGHKYVLKGFFVLIFGAALGLGGPYGTFELWPVLPRIAFWITVLFLPWLIWELLFGIASKFLPEGLNSRLLMALLMPVYAVVGSAIVTWLGIQFGFLGRGSFLEEWPISIVKWLAFSFAIILPLILISDELSQRQRKSGGSDLLLFLTDKLPPKLRGGQLIALKSEDHYLRVYTSVGHDLILMSMENALVALSGYPGVRTHRSWWVALDQLSGSIDKENLLSEVQLSSGLRVPISRRRTKLVKTAIEDFRKS